MQQFTFTLKDNTQKAFNSFSWFLFCLHIIIISVVIIKGADSYHASVAWITAFLFTLTLFSFFFFKNRFSLQSFQLLLFLLMTGFWIAQLAWLPALVLTGIIIFARFVSKKKSIAVFSNEHISISKSLFKKDHSWAEVANVVLKDHLLSIDFKNNHLLQLEVTPESYTIDEAAFNQFCRQHLPS